MDDQEMQDEAGQMIALLEGIIALNIDNTPKKVGDKVIPWDGSSLTTIDGKDIYIINEPFISASYWIVISNTERNRIKHYIGDGYIQDLIIINPKNNKQIFRISSDHVKLFIS